MKIDWVKKLSSRKFWMALIALVAAVAATFKFLDETIAQITSIISAAGVLIIYILCESYIDAKSISNGTDLTAELINESPDTGDTYITNNYWYETPNNDADSEDKL